MYQITTKHFCLDCNDTNCRESGAEIIRLRAAFEKIANGQYKDRAGRIRSMEGRIAEKIACEALSPKGAGKP